MSILERILKDKREEVFEREKQIPEAELRRLAEAMPPTRGFRSQLLNGATPVAVIAECKRASPSRGVLCENYDPASIASSYYAGGASCLSVLTDSLYFGGSLADLLTVRNTVPLPILRKDFILCPYQLYEARTSGADCVLLIAAALEIQKSKELFVISRELGMDVLFEVHNEHEMEQACQLGSNLVGINHRDLATFQIDLGLTARLSRHAPEGAILVAESGIQTREDVLTMGEAGAKAVLIGEHLMSSEDPVRELNKLVGRDSS
jgi:indole-3-glycerol phosphate synthase